MPLPSSTRRRPRLLGTLAAALVVALGVGVGPAAAAVPIPQPVVAYRGAPEALARYAGQLICTSTAQPGTLALSQLIKKTYAGYGAQTVGTTRSCSQGGRSEHKDGRALDWMLDVNDPADRALATAFLGWLIGPDAQGVQAGNARRLGVMYVIWNKQSWAAYDQTPSWQPYTGASPHTDHIHLSLSWDGALKRTSFWSGVPTTRYDYGPCQLWIGEAPVPGPHYDRCPAPRVRPGEAFPRRWNADLTADVIAEDAAGGLLMYPGTGAGSLRGAVRIGHGWSSMSAVTAVGDLDRDGRRDLVARNRDGHLLLYRGSGAGSFLGATFLGRGWGSMETVLGPGDVNQDGVVDVIARRGDGAVLLFPGTGRGGLGVGVPVADAAEADLLRAVGDWDGDGFPDLVMRVHATAQLQLLGGDGRGGFEAPRTIGTGWSGIDAIVGTGDFTGDGRADLLARSSSGRLSVYRGDGSGGFAGTSLVGRGWGGATLVN